MKLTNITKILLGGALLLGTITLAQADDNKVDPSGTYIWVMHGRNGGMDRTNTLVLKLEGDQLTGKLSMPGRGGKSRDTEIMDGKVTGNDISFCLVHTYGGNSFTNNYSGTLADGVIKGKIGFVTRNGDARSRKWEATLQK